MERFVSSIGYEVEISSSGQAAWEAISSNPDKYALVIVDLMMPDMPGDTLAHHILNTSSATRVLICSGYPIDTETFPREQRARIGFLHKPFLPKMLLDSVEKLMKTDESGECRTVSH
jgi:DNA-binding NtrC family response regulator